MNRRTRREFLKETGVAAASAGALAALAGRVSDASSTSRAGRPNILLFYPDQHRHDWIGDSPDVPVRTPNLDALAARGIRFTNALTPSPVCAPARACLAAGKEYDRCRVASNGVNYPLDQTTIYTLLRESGYRVMGCGKFDLHKASPLWGIRGRHLLAEWGFSDGIDNAGKWDAINSGSKKPRDPYMYYLEQRGLRMMHIGDFRKRRGNKAATFPTPLPEDAYCDNWIADNGLELLKRVPKREPWFLQVNFTGPHDPWDITERMERLCRGLSGFPSPNGSKQFTAEQHVAIRQNYSAMVENIDRWLGIYVEELRKRRELENTLIVFTSDHGEMLGDHNRWGKSTPYHPSVGVPLVIAGPGVRKGRVNKSPVSVMDLAATFLDCAELEKPAEMDSRSLVPLLRGETGAHREYVLSGLGRWRLAFDGRYKLIRGYGSQKGAGKKDKGAEAAPLLFDLAEDPLENENIAETAPDIVERLSRILDRETSLTDKRGGRRMPKRTAGAIITREGERGLEVLLTLRTVNPFKGRWCFPGGHVDPGETPEQTVVREVKEEIGLDFRGTFFREFEEIIPDMKINNRVSFFAGTAKGALRPAPDEVGEVRWFTIAEAQKLDLAFRHNEVLEIWHRSK